MKQTYVLLLLLSIVSGLSAQPWLKSLPLDKQKSQLTLKNYKDAFYNYWAPFKVENGYYDLNRVKTQAAGWKQFKRWEYDMESQVNPITGEFPKQTAYEIYKEYLKANPQLKSESLTNTSNWTSLGPNKISQSQIYSNMGSGLGRTNCITFHPTDNNTWWVGTASGGLWITTNGGSTYRCLTDNTGVLAISDIAIPIDYATSKTIYIATGDEDGFANNSMGLLKSTDEGVTWENTGITYPLANSAMVNRLLIDPKDNHTI